MGQALNSGEDLSPRRSKRAQLCPRGQGTPGGDRVCSYIGVLLADLVGVQGVPVGLREGRHLQAERGVSPEPPPPGCSGKGRQLPAPLSHPLRAGKRRWEPSRGGRGCCPSVGSHWDEVTASPCPFPTGTIQSHPLHEEMPREPLTATIPEAGKTKAARLSCNSTSAEREHP